MGLLLILPLKKSFLSLRPWFIVQMGLALDGNVQLCNSPLKSFCFLYELLQHTTSDSNLLSAGIICSFGILFLLRILNGDLIFCLLPFWLILPLVGIGGSFWPSTHVLLRNGGISHNVAWRGGGVIRLSPACA